MEEEFKNLQIVGYEEAVGQCSCVLPGDLIVEILQRLPVKSLLRFKSASKPWQFVIRSSKFIAKHLIHHQEHKKKKKGDFNHLHVYSYDLYNYGVPSGCKAKHYYYSLCYCPLVTRNTFPRISLISNREDGKVITSALSHSPYEVLFQSVSIVGSSNGLVCIKFCLACWNDNNGHKGTCFAIWNPATRKIICLPHPQRVSSVVGEVCNIIDGFSYIPSTSSYKLVEIWVFKANNVRFGARVQVLNMGENIWREVECQGQDEAIGRRVEFQSTRVNYVHNQPLVVNGCLHWLGILRHGGLCMVSFDLDKEVFTQTALPYPFNDHVKCLSRLAVFEDNLAVFVCPDSTLIDATNDQEFCFEVLVYDRTGESWTKRFSFGPLLVYEHPVGFLGNDEVVIRIMEPFRYGSKSYLYNLNNKEKRDFCCSSDLNCNFVFEPYIESLVEI